MPNVRPWGLAPALAMALVAVADAQPVNDDCADATVIASLPFTDSVDTTTATTEAGDPSCYGAELWAVPVPESNSVWYTYTPSTDVMLTVDVGDSDTSEIGATVALGACGALAIIDCNSVTLHGQWVTVPVNAGTTAFIEVADERFSSGGANAVVHVTATPLTAVTPRHTGVDFQVNEGWIEYERFPDVASDASGNFVAVWSGRHDGDGYGVVGRRFDAGASPSSGDFVVNTYTLYWQSYARVAMDPAGAFVVAWQSLDQVDGTDVIAQRFDAAGAPLGGELVVNTYTTGGQYYPDVAIDASGNFVVVWQSKLEDGSGMGVFGQRFDAAGTPAGSEFQVNDYTTNDQRYPAVSMAADGAFVVAWESQAQDGSGLGIFARRYDASGAPAGSEFQVNVTTMWNQATPTVAMDPSGGFLVAWVEGEVVGRAFGSDGAPLGGEIEVSRTGFVEASYPASAVNADGDFIVAWTESGVDVHPDIIGDRVIARRLSSTGAPVGGEFQVNTYATRDQLRPAIGMAATGQFVVVWEDYTEYPGRDHFGPGIFGHRLTLPPVTTVGVRPTKLIVVDKTSTVGKAKVVYVAKDQSAGIAKGAAVDPAAVSARFDFGYDAAAGGFVAPAGASDGTTGWVANKPAVAKYVNKTAGLTPGSSIKVTVLKTGKLIKVVSKGLGDDATLDLVAAGPPAGPVRACYTLENGGDVFRFGSEWGPSDCTLKEIAGGAGRKLVCTGGTGDPACAVGS